MDPRDRETWVALVMNVNAFIHEAGDQALATPFYVRLTGINDQVAVFAFNDITPNKVYDADIQLAVPANDHFNVVTLEPENKPSDAPKSCPACERVDGHRRRGPREVARRIAPHRSRRCHHKQPGAGRALR